ncbi:MAG: hypothetical protein KAR31_11740, partial [Candidatus Omnitrophica bacterium]|nr:hypothetical protein [Candidatus Omnitrophota bacterium]
MNFKKIVTITCIGIISLAFAATPLHAKPKEDKGNKGKPKANKQIHKPEKKNPPSNNKLKNQNKDPQKTLKSAVIKTSDTPRSHTIQREKDASQSKALRPLVQNRLDRR